MLIVDDNSDDLAVYSRWLRECTRRRITVVTASSLARAVDIARAFKPDCIVLDHDLGDATGLQVMREFARLGVERPIIAITGSGSEAIAVALMKAGARDYISKSELSAETLCSAVIAQLSPRGMRQQIALYRKRERGGIIALGVALKRASFLAEIGKLFAATRGYDELVGVAVSRALPFLGQACTLDLIESGVLYRAAVHVDDTAGLLEARDGASLVAPDRDSAAAVARVMREDSAIYLSGAAFFEASRADLAMGALAAAGLAAAACLPLRFSGSVFGVLTLGTTRLSGFSEEERLMLYDYAQRVAIAISNARLAESEHFQRERAETAKRRLIFQSRISTLFAQSLEWEKALQKLMNLVTTSLCDSAAIFAVDVPQQRIHVVAAAAQSAKLGPAIAQYYHDVPPLFTDGFGCGQVARTGRSEFFSDTSSSVSVGSMMDAAARRLISAWAPISDIFVPLTIKGVVVGVLSLVRDVSRKRFTSEELVVAEDIARRTATYLENARLYENEHRIAAALQKALLPVVLPQVTEFSFGVRYFAGTEGIDVGGDWYDIIEVDEDRIVITIGDVIGRGLKAASTMGQYRDYLRSYAFERFGPAMMLTRLNHMANALHSDDFATCTLIVLDRHTRRMRYSSAGHPPAMLRLADGTVRVLDDASSMPIGAWPETQYSEMARDMPVGSTLLLYTDGLVETRVRSASDGVEVLRVALSRSSPNIEAMLDGMVQTLAAERSDDVAILAVEVLPLQSEKLKRWAFRRLDRVILRRVCAEFEAVLEAHGVRASDMYSARSILGELLANIVQHAPGPFCLEFEWDDECPELRLYDSGPGFAECEEFAKPDDSMSMTGRGLFLIAEASQRFVMVPRASGGLMTTVVLHVHRKAEQRELVGAT